MTAWATTWALSSTCDSTTPALCRSDMTPTALRTADAGTAARAVNVPSDARTARSAGARCSGTNDRRHDRAESAAASSWSATDWRSWRTNSADPASTTDVSRRTDCTQPANHSAPSLIGRRNHQSPTSQIDVTKCIRSRPTSANGCHLFAVTLSLWGAY